MLPEPDLPVPFGSPPSAELAIRPKETATGLPPELPDSKKRRRELPLLPNQRRHGTLCRAK
jgi:hypothetical protein